MENISLVTLFSRQFFLDWSENLVHRGVDIPSRSHCTHFMKYVKKTKQTKSSIFWISERCKFWSTWISKQTTKEKTDEVKHWLLVTSRHPQKPGEGSLEGGRTHLSYLFYFGRRRALLFDIWYFTFSFPAQQRPSPPTYGTPILKYISWWSD